MSYLQDGRDGLFLESFDISLLIQKDPHHLENFVFVIPIPRFLQLCRRGYLEDSRSFDGDPPHLTFDHGFPVIGLSQLKTVA